MKENLSVLFQGWANYIGSRIQGISDRMKEIAKDRASICDSCPIRSMSVCDPTKSGVHVITKDVKKGCGCFIPAKILAEGSVCPLGKW